MPEFQMETAGKIVRVLCEQSLDDSLSIDAESFERAAFYAANARTFWQAALMAEDSSNATP